MGNTNQDMPQLNKRLEGVAIVTGAGSGIGRAVALAFSAAGIDTLWLTDLHRPGLEETIAQIKALNLPNPPEIISNSGDICCPLSVTSLFEKIPRLDYAVNCAGVLGPVGPTTETSLADFDNVNDINYRGVFMCVKEELKLMLKNDVRPYRRPYVGEDEARIRGQRGSIVNISSQLGVVGQPELPVYAASKAAVMALTRSDAVDYSKPPHHIRLNSICPGVIQTPMTCDEEGQPKTESLKKSVSIAPMDRMGLPSEIADAAVFLCSGESSFITGSSMVVDGGYVIN